MDSGFRVLDSSLFQWNLDSRFHSLVGYLISILDSKALDSGFHRNNFPGFRILQAKIFQTPESGYQSNIFWPVHAYLIKQWEIYFSSNVRFYNMMDRSNFWSMQLFQTGPHFKLEEVWFWKGIFPSCIWITEDFAVTVDGIVTQRQLNHCLNLSWNLRLWIALCHKFYCINWRNSY